MSTDRKTLRRMVGRRLGDLRVLTATAVGTTTTFVDDKNLVAPDNAYRGRDLYVTGGTAGNLGQVRRTTGSSQSAHNLTLGVDLPVIPQIGDEAELWNARTLGWHPSEAEAAINDGIVLAGAQFWIPTSQVISSAFAMTSPVVTVPATWRAIFAVEYQDSIDAARYHTVPRANAAGAPGYYLNAGQGTVTIEGDWWRSVCDGRTIRLRGYGPLSQLATDSDTTTVNAEWLVVYAAYQMLTAHLDVDTYGADNRQKLQVIGAEVEVKRALATGRMETDTQIVS